MARSKKKPTGKKKLKLVKINSTSSPQNEDSHNSHLSNPEIRAILIQLKAMKPLNQVLSLEDIKFIKNTLYRLDEGKLDPSRRLISELHEIIKFLSQMECENFNYPLAIFFDMELKNLVYYLNSENVVNYFKATKISIKNINTAFQCSINLLQEFLSLSKEKIIRRPGSLVIDLQTAFDSFNKFFLIKYIPELKSHGFSEFSPIKYKFLSENFDKFVKEYHACIERFEALSLPESTPAFVEYNCKKIMYSLEEEIKEKISKGKEEEISKEISDNFNGNWQEYILSNKEKGNFNPQQKAAELVINKAIEFIVSNNDFYKTGFLKRELLDIFNKLIGDNNIYFYKNSNEISTLSYASAKFIYETNIIFMIAEYYKFFANASLKALKSNQDITAVINNEKKLQDFFNHNMNGPFPKMNVDELLCWENLPMVYIEYIKKQIISFFNLLVSHNDKPTHSVNLKNKSLSELCYLVTKHALDAIYQQNNPTREQTEFNCYAFSHFSAHFMHLSELENNVNLEKKIQESILKTESDDDLSKLIDFLAFKVNIVPESHIKELAIDLTLTGLKIASTIEIDYERNDAHKLYNYIIQITTKVYEILSGKYNKDDLDIRVHLMPVILKLFDYKNNDKRELVYTELLKLTKENLNTEDTIAALSNSMKWFDLVFDIIAGHAYLQEADNVKIESCKLLFEVYANKIEKIISLSDQDPSYGELLEETLLVSKKSIPYKFNDFIAVNEIVMQKNKAYYWAENESEKCWSEIYKYDNFYKITEIIELNLNNFIKEFYQEKDRFIEHDYKKLTYFKNFFSDKVGPKNLFDFYNLVLETYKISKGDFPLENVIANHFKTLATDLKTIFQNTSQWEVAQFDLLLMLVAVFLQANNNLLVLPVKQFKKFLDEEGENILKYIDVLQTFSKNIIETTNKHKINISKKLSIAITKLDQSKNKIHSKIVGIKNKKDPENKPAQHKEIKVPDEQSSYNTEEVTRPKKQKKKNINPTFFSPIQVKNEIKEEVKNSVQTNTLIDKEKKQITDSKISNNTIIMKPLEPPIEISKYRERNRTYRDVLLANMPQKNMNAKQEIESNIPETLQITDDGVDDEPEQPNCFDDSKIIIDEFHRRQYFLLQEITHLTHCYNYLYDKINLIKHPFTFKILLDLIEMYYYQLGDKLVNIIGKINRIQHVQLNEVHERFVAQFNKIMEQMQFLPHQEGQNHPLSKQLYPIIGEIIKYNGQDLSLAMQLTDLFTCISRSDDLALYESIKILVNYEPKDCYQVDIPLNFYDLNFHFVNSQVIEHYRFLVYLTELYPRQIGANDLESFKRNLNYQHAYIEEDLKKNYSLRWELLEIQFKNFKEIVEIISFSYSLNSYLNSSSYEEFKRTLNEKLEQLSINAGNLIHYYKKIDICFDVQNSLERCVFLSLSQINNLNETLIRSVKDYIPAKPQRMNDNDEELEDTSCQIGIKL